MHWRRANGRVVCALASMLLTVGCASERAEEPASSSTPAQAPTSAPTAPPPTVDLGWKTAGTFPRGESPEVASRDYVGVTMSEGAANGTAAELRRRDGSVVLRHRAADGYYVQFLLLEDPYLVIVEMDEQHKGKPDRMTIYDLPTGNRRSVGAQIPEPWSGLWSLGGGMLTYGTHGSKGRYCLTEVALGEMSAQEVDCVGQGHGISQARRSPFGVGFGVFDHGRKPCPTLHVRRDDEAPAAVDVTHECADSGDVLPVSDDSILWSTVPDPHEVERAEFHVQVGTDAPESLGTGSNGSLVWCGDAAWFVRQMEGQLMRWTPQDGLAVALHLPTGDDEVVAVMSTPLCGGDAISVIEGRAGPKIHKQILHVAPVDSGS